MKRFIILVFAGLGFQAQAQDLDSLLNISAYTQESELQEQLNHATTVASGKALTTRETPGILSVVTADEIQKAGARDLTDILRLIPGFDIAQDLQFVVGAGMRGNWANDGKILILLNGFPMNDLLYQKNALLNHFPVDFIERIEIIRGPGSALYGGSAEYGVINIITKSTESLNGIAVTGAGGVSRDSLGRANAGIMAAQHGKNMSWDISAYKGKSIVSDQSYQNMSKRGPAQDLRRTSYADPVNMNLGLQYKNLSFRTMYDTYDVSEPSVKTSFQQYFATLKYDWKVAQKITITPQIMFTHQTPWSTWNKSTNAYTFRTQASRVTGNLLVNYDVSRKININAGALYYHDKAEDLLKSNHYNGSNYMNLYNYAVFAQGLLVHRLANVTLGFRYEKNSRTDGAFVPRLALTKKIENFHFKALYSEAFRTPSIENIVLAQNGKISPERTHVFELEVGYQFTPEMLIAVNGFSLNNHNAIIYANEEQMDGSFISYYSNYSKTGTQGIEAIYSIRKKKWYVNLSYSYARPVQGNTVTSYTISLSDKQYLGMLSHKVTLNSNVTLIKGLSLNPSVIVGSKRYTYTPNLGPPAEGTLPAYTLVNAFLRYEPASLPFTIGAGVYDLLNQRPAIPQAYDGDYAAIPGKSREYILKLSYQFNFAKK